MTLRPTVLAGIRTLISGPVVRESDAIAMRQDEIFNNRGVSVVLNYLYIGGPSRSGTTALTSYLNRHPEVMICQERFMWVPREDITPEVFTFERILDFEDGYEKRNTARRKQIHEELVGSKDPDKLRWMGDKCPAYVRTLDGLSENNPGAGFILTYRPVEEVAESYEARSRNPEDPWLGGRDGFRLGIEGWNMAMQHTKDFIEGGVNPNVLVVGYHDFFYRNEEVMPLVSRFLDLTFDESVIRSWREESRSFEGERREKEPVNEEQQALIDEHADREAEAYVLRRIEQQYEEFDLYSPEVAHLLIEERRRLAVRIAGKRNAAKTEQQVLKDRLRKAHAQMRARRDRIEALSGQNEKLHARAAASRDRAEALSVRNTKLTRRVENLTEQIRAVHSSRSWKLLNMSAAIRNWVLGEGRRLRARLTGTARGGTSGGQGEKKDRAVHERKKEDNAEPPRRGVH